MDRRETEQEKEWKDFYAESETKSDASKLFSHYGKGNSGDKNQSRTVEVTRHR